MGLKLFWGAWLCQPWFRPCLLPCLHSPLPINTHTRAQTAEWQTTNTRSLGLLEPPVFLRKMAKNHSSLPRPAPNAPSPSMRQKASIKLLRAGGDRSAQGSHCRLNYQRSLETFRLEGDGRGEEEVNPDAEASIGKKADKNRKIYNGMMKTYLYQFMGPKPPRKMEG